MAFLPVFFWRMDTGNCSGHIETEKFANRGLVNGPYCVMYGFTAVLMTVGLQELTGFWLFLLQQFMLRL